ncbi:small ribosomal subunit protein uS10m-like isoform X1 [Ptychodera flava]|uniref:small ribosomal subunit protein uS10m-like isoform X1 n=1 Tax=Ptychodera flava TaxID=63121 RepID=UPI003969E271
MFNLQQTRFCILNIFKNIKVYGCLQQFQGFQRCLFTHRFYSVGRTHWHAAIPKPCCTVLISRNLSSTIQIDETDEPDSLFKRITLKLKGHDDSVLDSYQQFVTMAAGELDINVSDIKILDRHNKRYTLLKSRHIYKKHRVQYEIRTYMRQIELKHLTGSTADTFLEYIERNLPEGVAMHVQKVKVEEVPSHIKPPTATSDKQ